MFINTGGLPEHHRPYSGGQLYQRRLQPQRHYHGNRHIQQLNQLHLPYRSRHLTARRILLPPAPCHHGNLFPAPLLLSPWIPPHTLPPSPILPTSAPSTALNRDHKTNIQSPRWTPQPLLFLFLHPYKKKKRCNFKRLTFLAKEGC